MVVSFVGTCQKFYCDKTIGIPMLSTKNLSLNGLKFDKMNYVSKEFHEKNKKSQLKYNDILIARHGKKWI